MIDVTIDEKKNIVNTTLNAYISISAQFLVVLRCFDTVFFRTIPNFLNRLLYSLLLVRST